jgi:hypothetical protein
MSRGESSARHFESTAARDGFKIVLFGFKKSSEGFIANDSQFSAVFFGFITSSDESKKSSRRFKKSSERFSKSLGGITFVLLESSANGARLFVALSGFFASSARLEGDVRRRIAGGRGVSKGGAVSTPSGSGLSIASSHPSMVTCP